MQNSLIERLHSFFLYLFVFSIPYGDWDLGIGWSISALLAIPFFGISLFNRKYFSLKNISSVVFSLLIWLFLVIFSNLVYNGSFDSKFVTTFFQCIIMYVIIINTIRDNDKIRINILKVFVLSFLSMTILFFLGIGVDYYGGRVSLFGTNPNAIGLYGVFSLSIILSFYFDKLIKKSKILFFIMSILFVLFIAETGSRGAIISLFLSFMILSLYKEGTGIKKFLFIIMVSIISLVIINYMFEASPLLKERFFQMVEEGDESRSGVWEIVLGLINRNLVLGLGTNGYRLEIIKILGYMKDPHNVFLYILVTTGILGGVVMFIFIYNHWKLIINNRSIYYKNGLGIVFFVLVLFLWSKGGGTLYIKTTWLFLALSVSKNLQKNR